MFRRKKKSVPDDGFNDTWDALRAMGGKSKTEAALRWYMAWYNFETPYSEVASDYRESVSRRDDLLEKLKGIEARIVPTDQPALTRKVEKQWEQCSQEVSFAHTRVLAYEGKMGMLAVAKLFDQHRSP